MNEKYDEKNGPLTTLPTATPSVCANFLDPVLPVRKIRKEPPTWEEVLSSNLLNEITKKVILYMFDV